MQPTRLHEHYLPSTPARAVHASSARFKVVVTGRRGGKTTTAAEQFLQQIYGWDLPRAMAQPYRPGAAERGSAQWWERRGRLHYWVIAPTYRLLRESKAVLLQALPPGLLEHADVSKNVWWLYPDIKLEWISAKNPDDLVSAGLNGIWMDEAALIASRVWVGRVRQTLADKGGWAIVTSTPMGRNWIYDHLVEPALRGVRGYEFFTWRTVDNDRVPNLREEVESQRDVLPPMFFKREYEASFDAFSGQIFVGWDANMKLKRIPDGVRFKRVLGGVDWGTTNPGALEVVAESMLGHIYVIDERYQSGQLVEDYWAPEALKLTAQHGVQLWVCDPEAPDNIMRFRRAGLRTTRHSNSTWTGKFDEHRRSVVAGIRTVTALMHSGKFWVLENACPNLISELPNYVWRHLPSSKGTSYAEVDYVDEPASHQKCHAIDAVRYPISWGVKPPTMRSLQGGEEIPSIKAA